MNTENREPLTEMLASRKYYFPKKTRIFYSEYVASALRRVKSDWSLLYSDPTEINKEYLKHSVEAGIRRLQKFLILIENDLDSGNDSNGQ